MQQEEKPLTSQLVVLSMSWQCSFIRNSGCRCTRLGLPNVGRSTEPGCRSNRGYRTKFMAPTVISIAQQRICRPWGSRIELTTSLAPSHQSWKTKLHTATACKQAADVVYELVGPRLVNYSSREHCVVSMPSSRVSLLSPEPVETTS